MAIAERRLAHEFNRPGHDDRRPPDLRHRLRRRPPGGHRLRGGQPRRPPAPRQARRPLRRQPHPARRADRDGLLRGRPDALRCLRLAHPARRGRQRPRRHRGRDRGRPSRRPPEPHRRPDPHRLRQPEQAGQPEGARLAARPRRGPPDQGGLRLGSGPDVLRPGRRRATASARRSPRARPWSPTGRRASTPTATPIPSAAAEFRRRVPAVGLPDGWDADLKTYETGDRGRDAERQPGRDPGARPASARAVRRRRRPVRVEPDRHQGRAGLQRRRGRPEPALRGPRARHGRHRQRHRLPRRVHPLLRHVPDLQRLHARVGPAGGAVRAPRHLRLDPRFGRARRGRPDPPAGRALRRAPGDPQPVVRPARRRQRDRGGLGARGRAHRRAGRAGPHPPEAADPARHGPAGARGRRPRRLRPARGVGRRARADPDRHRLGAPAGLRRRRGARGRGHPDPGRVAAVLGAVRGAGPGLPRRRPAAGRAASGSASRSASRSAGSAGSATRARSSASITSARRRRPARSSSTSASPRTASTDVARRVVRDGLRGRIPTVDGGHFGGHPTIGAGEAGVARSGGSDPGHS